MKEAFSSSLIIEELLLERRESEVVKTSGSSDDNKPEFFETASLVLNNSGLFQGAGDEITSYVPSYRTDIERATVLNCIF